MALLLDAAGLFGTALTAIGFFQSNFPPTAPEGPTVNIKAGLPPLDKEADDLGGSISNVFSFDERNGYGGMSDGCQIGSGGICTKTVDQSVGGRRAGYISVANNNDATCIAWITVQQFDSSKGGAWTGDIGKSCGQVWYNSVEPAGEMKDEDGGGEYVPKCTWLDGDHTNTITNSALKFDVSAYGEDVLDTVDKDACAPTLYGADNGAIAGQPGPAKRSIRRAPSTRPAWMTDQLILSTWTSQPASELCDSATSWGPDFIGSDGQFCDMESKTLTPLCATEEVEGCIEVDETVGNLVKRMRVARRDTGVVHKSYKKISKWGKLSESGVNLGT